MCSIEGFTGPQPFTIEDYTKFNKDRGPDDTNYWSDQNISFGHNLLSISPNKSKKTQPYVTDKGNVLIYNGEIFGIPDQFDTEWLANKIENEGIHSLKNGVNGMWAFAWYVPKDERVWLVRDHFGVKPLYYLEIGTDMFFSSTPKPLYAVINKYSNLEIDPEKMNHFQKSDRFMPGSLIPYKEIKKVPPGKILCYNLKERRFGGEDSMWGGKSTWSLDMDLKWDPEELEDKFVKCFKEVLAPGPDVDKTISLSGGLDSTLIASILSKDKVSATSCSWELEDTDLETTRQGMFDESILAEKTCKQLNIEFNKSFVPRDFNSIMPEAYKALGLPIWDRNRIVPRYVNVKQAAENGNKVFIVGDCADELLTGYNGDFNVFYPSHATTRNFTSNDVQYWTSRSKHKLPNDDYIPTHLFGNDHINNYLLFRTLCMGESFCLVADHLAGSFGMESRMPFLHQDLAKYILKIPGVYKLHVPFDHGPKDYKKRKNERFWRMGNYKSILRDHMKQYYPEHVLNRVQKIGFANPWDARDDKKNMEFGEADTNMVNLLMKKLTFN